MNRVSVLLRSVLSGILLTVLIAAAIYGVARAGASFLGAAFILFGIPSALVLAIVLPEKLARLFHELIQGSSDQRFFELCLLGGIFQLLVICSLWSYHLWFSRRTR